jgi:uncharacterized protein
MHDSLYVLLKTGNVCNLRCTYCYDHCAGPPRWLPPETLQLLLRQLLEFPQSRIVLAWHGGEPLLAGLEYFVEAIAIQRSSMSPHQQLFNCLHSNGLALNSKWIDWLAANGFSISISLDGPRSFHDRQRRTASGQGSFDGVHRALTLLSRSPLAVNVSVTVREDSWTVASDLYQLCKQVGVETIEFTPLLQCHYNGQVVQSVTPEAYRRFVTLLCTLWLADGRSGGERPSIPRFDEILARASGEIAAASCWCDPDVCSSNLMVTRDGDVFPCDLFNGMTAMKLGNINHCSLKKMLNGASDLGRQADNRIPSQCLSCRVRDLCRAGCRYQRFLADPSLSSPTPYCSTHLSLFDMLSGRKAGPRSTSAAQEEQLC